MSRCRLFQVGKNPPALDVGSVNPKFTPNAFSIPASVCSCRFLTVSASTSRQYVWLIPASSANLGSDRLSAILACRIRSPSPVTSLCIFRSSCIYPLTCGYFYIVNPKPRLDKR